MAGRSLSKKKIYAYSSSFSILIILLSLSIWALARASLFSLALRLYFSRINGIFTIDINHLTIHFLVGKSDALREGDRFLDPIAAGTDELRLLVFLKEASAVRAASLDAFDVHLTTNLI
jgi:hypothetical protein